PPTTLIGALAQPIAQQLRWPENTGQRSSADIIRSRFRGIYLALNLPFVEYSDLTKIFSYDPDDKQILKDAAAVAKIYTGPSPDSSRSLRVVYVFDENGMESEFGPRWEEVLVPAAWSISRFGARESIVSVNSVAYGDLEVVEAREAETNYYFPADRQIPTSGSYFFASVVDWRTSSIGDYVGKPTVQLIVPYDIDRRVLSTVKVKPRDGAVYIADGEVLIPW
ncbi:MAG: hypothetical protein NZ581_09065, partial [Candidatus Caldarchaeum sp.]|nr:hypothetical protein [Candidatus Caldarchaeum sp.]MDW8436322.1 hypothetical protein [Candidatus Caldarchaeum sp.]